MGQQLEPMSSRSLSSALSTTHSTSLSIDQKDQDVPGLCLGRKKITLTKTLTTQGPQLYFYPNHPQMYSRACLFSLIAGQGLPGVCPNFSLPQRSTLTERADLIFKRVQTPCLSKWHDICIKPELRCSGAGDAFRKTLALFLSISLSGDHLAHASVSAQPASQPEQGGRNWASCLTTLMLKCVEHSQATELC